ncbi:MAG: ATP-binding protein [Bdellovibrionales bacterium]|nr:ATP-binding protein [Bdellovibrionales bacterium]
MIRRTLARDILEYSKKKIILITGPRQVGKTTLVKELLGKKIAYYNYDDSKDRNAFKNKSWDYHAPVVVFDELHKMKNWKAWLKGLYDGGHLQKQAIIVTGSARLDLLKKTGDSLAGRFFSYSLHPLDLKELKHAQGTAFKPDEAYQTLINISNFPEPYLEGTQKFYQQWKRGHSDIIIRQDLITLEAIRDIDGMLLLIDLLAARVGSTISYNSLSEDLDRDDKTVKKWIRTLETLYIGFKLEPYSKNIARAKKKAFKFYFYDLGKVDGDEAAKLENMAALAIKKQIDSMRETRGQPAAMHFIQTDKDKEIDFLVLQPKKPATLIEVKLSDDQVSRSFRLLGKHFKDARKLQLVKNLDRAFNTQDGVRVEDAIGFLQDIEV